MKIIFPSSPAWDPTIIGCLYIFNNFNVSFNSVFLSTSYLCATVGALTDAEPEEGGVRHLDEDVVDAVDVDVLDAAVDDVLQNRGVFQRSVQAAITI